MFIKYQHLEKLHTDETDGIEGTGLSIADFDFSTRVGYFFGYIITTTYRVVS